MVCIEGSGQCRKEDISSKMKIRKFTGRDFDEVYEIIKKEYGKKPYNEKWPRENAKKTLNYYSKWGEIYVAEINNEVVGFLVVHQEFYNDGPALHVKELAVNCKFQGRGIGKALMKKAEELCRKRKIKSLYLTTSRKAPAYHFYKKIGYVPSKTTVFFSKELK